MVIQAICALAVLFTFVSALWQHTASATAATLLEHSTVSLVKGDVGSVGVALAWLVFGLWMVVFLGIFIMIRSIKILDRLTDDD